MRFDISKNGVILSSVMVNKIHNQNLKGSKDLNACKETIMDKQKYNGWTNYATWRVALEFFDYVEDFSDAFQHYDDLKDYVLEALDCNCENDTTFSYAHAFLDDVNWYEIYENKKEEEEDNARYAD